MNDGDGETAFPRLVKSSLFSADEEGPREGLDLGMDVDPSGVNSLLLDMVTAFDIFQIAHESGCRGAPSTTSQRAFVVQSQTAHEDIQEAIPSFPTEVVYHILSFVHLPNAEASKSQSETSQTHVLPPSKHTATATLHSAALVCRQWNCIANRMLYCDIHIPCHTVVESLLRTLREDAGLCAHVRSFAYLPHQRPPNPALSADEKYRAILYGQAWVFEHCVNASLHGCAMQIISLCPCLTSIRLTAWHVYFPVILSKGPLDGPGVKSRLTELVLDGRDWVAGMLPRALANVNVQLHPATGWTTEFGGCILPALRSLKVQNMTIDGMMVWPNTPSLETLVLKNVCLGSLMPPALDLTWAKHTFPGIQRAVSLKTLVVINPDSKQMALMDIIIMRSSPTLESFSYFLPKYQPRAREANVLYWEPPCRFLRPQLLESDLTKTTSLYPRLTNLAIGPLNSTATMGILHRLLSGQLPHSISHLTIVDLPTRTQAKLAEFMQSIPSPSALRGRGIKELLVYGRKELSDLWKKWSGGGIGDEMKNLRFTYFSVTDAEQ